MTGLVFFTYAARAFFAVACWLSRDRKLLALSGTVLLLGTALDGLAYRVGKPLLDLEHYVVLRSFTKAHLIMFLSLLLPWRFARWAGSVASLGTGVWALVMVAAGVESEELFRRVQIVDQRVWLSCTAWILAVWSWSVIEWFRSGRFVLRRPELIVGLFLILDVVHVVFDALADPTGFWRAFRVAGDTAVFLAAAAVALARFPTERELLVDAYRRTDLSGGRSEASSDPS
jgi:hypothetical protein